MIPIDRAHRLRIRRWHGCYDDSWKDLIVPEAFAHPAKFSRGLIERIVMHCIERGWLKPGDTVVDPFGGVALGGIICGYHNIHWLGVELESRFCELGDCGYECDGTVEWAEVEEPATEPIPDCPGGWFVRLRVEAAYWGRDGIRRDGDWGDTPGFECESDAQRFIEVLLAQSDRWPKDYYEAIDTKPIIGSPGEPARTVRKCVRKSKCGAEEAHDPHHVQGNLEMHRPKWKALGYGVQVHLVQGDSRRLVEIVQQASAVVCSPPFGVGDSADAHSISQRNDRSAQWIKRTLGRGSCSDGYGSSPGQIGRMKAGDVDSVICSPPYQEGLRHGGEPTRGDGRGDDANLDGMQEGYGSTCGNLGNLKPGSVEAVVTSPPYEGTRLLNPCDPDKKRKRLQRLIEEGKITGWESVRCAAKGWNENRQVAGQTDYGLSDGQIGNTSGETYWRAVRDIYEQCYQILKPGGVMVVVVKAYVKNKRIVPLPDDTLKLLEHIGFEPVERIQAMLVKEDRKADLFGGEIVNRKERKSFFRRLVEQKGSPRIDHEDVLIVQKRTTHHTSRETSLEDAAMR